MRPEWLGPLATEPEAEERLLSEVLRSRFERLRAGGLPHCVHIPNKAESQQ